ncbi:MAG: EscU/YscU/HrcU family type III secretion system export apparatus switch protein [Myxococcota bacterium]|nr:EscU/YscU/HrcU family type III secretion system export apparatus switch protein [Myxococcota bacterium]
MGGESGEKTEEATPEKLRKSKEEGQVPKSQDFVGALGFAGGFFTLAGLIGYVGNQLIEYTRAAIDAAVTRPSEAVIAKLFEDAIPLLLQLTLPVAGIVFVLGIFSNVVQTGFFVAFKAVIPKVEKLNPIQGLKGLFKMKKFIELLKNLVKMAVVTYVAWDIMTAALADMVLVVSQPFENALEFGAGLLTEFMIKVTAVFIIIGVVDLIIARKQFAKEMMMSKHDVKQEYKQMEGDPQVKGQRKQLAHELLFSGSQENVKNADAVIVNPAHIAVAIKFDKEKDKAPKVVAKGMRKHAEKIKEIAKHYGVPILRNVPLAQALNKLEIDEEIPEELFEAVAEVLAFVYKIREEQETKNKGSTKRPDVRGAPAAPLQVKSDGSASKGNNDKKPRGAGRLKG